MNMYSLLSAMAPTEDTARQVGLLGLLPGLGGGSPGPSGAGRGINAPEGGNWEQIARQMAMGQHGYSPEDWEKLDYIIEHESGWSPTAINPKIINGKQAMGIPQRMMAPNMADSRWMNNPQAQLNWLFRYIQNRYGGIGSAYQHKVNTGWY